MKIGIGNDHRGFKLKQIIKPYLEEQGYTVVDYGSDSEEAVDYPVYAFKVGNAVKDRDVDLGILICGTGIGMSIACNKVKGVRCGKVSTIEEAKLTKGHNHANVIALSENVENPLEIVSTFINEPFLDEEKHIRRVDMIDNYDN